MSDKVDLALNNDQVIAYLAAQASMPEKEFLSKYAVFLRTQKRKVMPDPLFGGATYLDLFKSLGADKVKNYLKRLADENLTVLDLYPLAHFLRCAFRIYTVSESGAGIVLKRTINLVANTAQHIVDVAVVGGSLSLALNKNHPVTEATVRRRTAIAALALLQGQGPQAV